MLPYAVESLSLEAYAGPLHRRLYQALRDAILDARLAPDTKLPASREFASHLGISRNTVVAAFDQLQAEGYVTAKVGHGTRVASIAPENLIACAPPSRHAGRQGRLRGTSKDGDRGARAAVPLPFQPGEPDISGFPHRLWARLLARCAREGARLTAPYSEPFGDLDLRAAIARHLREYRGVQCEPGQVVITTSTQAGMTLMARLLLEPGDSVWLEDPAYPGAVAAFRGARAQITPVPVDSDGMNADKTGSAPSPKLIYVTPSHQFPLGPTMPLTRRLVLLDRAARAGAFVLEDDYDSEFRFSGRPVAALQGLDPAGRVIYVGTFSKTLMPGLRTGYLVLPRTLAQRFRSMEELAALQPPTPVQAALAEFIDQGHYAAHVRRMRTIYARRLSVLEDAAHALPPDARLASCSTGLQVPLYLAPETDDYNLTARGEMAGLRLSALSRFYLMAPPRRGLLLGFGAMPEARIPEHVATLARLLRENAAAA